MCQIMHQAREMGALTIIHKHQQANQSNKIISGNSNSIQSHGHINGTSHQQQDQNILNLTSSEKVQAIVQKNLALSLNQQIHNQQQYLIQQQKLVAEKLQMSGKFNNSNVQDRVANNNYSTIENTNNYGSNTFNNFINNDFNHNSSIQNRQNKQKQDLVIQNLTTVRKMNQTLCVPSSNPLSCKNEYMQLGNQQHQYQTIKKLELKINLNQTKDSVDSSQNSHNKLRLWSSLDNQSSHSFGRKENKRYKDEDDEEIHNNELMEIQEESSFMLTKDNVNHKNQNNKTKNYELDNHFDKEVKGKKNFNMTLQQQHHHDFNEFLNSSDLHDQHFKVPKFGRKNTKAKKEQSLVDEANRFSLNPNFNLPTGRETSQAITNQDFSNQNNINLVNVKMSQRPQTNMLTYQGNRSNMQSQLAVHQNIPKKKNKTSMFSMRLRPESDLSSHQNEVQQTKQINLQLDEHSLQRYNDREILSQTFTPVPQSAKNFNTYQKPFGLSFIHQQPQSTNHQNMIETRNANNSSLMRFAEAQERSKSRQNKQVTTAALASNMKFYSICEEPLSNEKAFSSNSKISKIGSRSKERVKKDLNEQINQLAQLQQNNQLLTKHVNNNYFRQQNIQGGYQANQSNFSNPKIQKTPTYRPNTSLNNKQNGHIRLKTNVTSGSSIDKKSKIKIQTTTTNHSIHNKVPSTSKAQSNQKGFQMFKQFTNQSFLTSNSNFDSKLSNRPSTVNQQQQNIQTVQFPTNQNNSSKVRDNKSNHNMSRPHTSMIDNQVCLGLAYMVSSKIFLKIQLDRQLQLKSAFEKIKKESAFSDLMEHINGQGNKPHQNIRHCKEHSRNLSLKPNNKSFLQDISGDVNISTPQNNEQSNNQTHQNIKQNFLNVNSAQDNQSKPKKHIQSNKNGKASRQTQQPKINLNQRALQLLFHPSSEDNTIVEEEENDNQMLRQSMDFTNNLQFDNASKDNHFQTHFNTLQNQVNSRKASNKNNARKGSNSQQNQPNNIQKISLSFNNNQNSKDLSNNYYEINLDNSDAAAYLSQDKLSPQSLDQVITLDKLNQKSKINKSLMSNNSSVGNGLDNQSNPVVVEYMQSNDNLNLNGPSNQMSGVGVAHHNHHNSEHFQNQYSNSLVENTQTQNALQTLNKLNSVTDNNFGDKINNHKQHMHTESDSMNQPLSNNNKILKMSEKQKRQEIQNQLNNLLNGLGGGMANQSMAIGTYDSNARSATTTSSNMALIEKLQGDTDLKKKLEKVISILSSIKNDFN
eukprot:403332517